MRAKKPNGEFEEIEIVYGTAVKFPDGQTLRGCDVVFEIIIKKG